MHLPLLTLRVALGEILLYALRTTLGLTKLPGALFGVLSGMGRRALVFVGLSLLAALFAAAFALGTPDDARAQSYDPYGYAGYDYSGYGSETCEASYYGAGFIGNLTASGSVFTGAAGTAAHPYLPFGTIVRVDSPYGTTYLTITDRGPCVAGRCLDVSEGSAWIVGYGVAPVRVTPV